MVSTRAKENSILLALLLFFLAIYLLTYSGNTHSSDGLSMLSVTESIVKRGDYDTNQILWMGLQQGTFGRGGELYSRKGVGTSLAALPLACLSMLLPLWGFAQTTLFLNVILTSLSALLVFLYPRRLGYSRKTSLTLALIFGLGTLAWPYSKYFFSEPLTGFCLLATAYLLLPNGRDLWRISAAGAFLGLAVATRLATAVLVPPFLLFLAYRMSREEPWRRQFRSCIWPLVAFLSPLLLWGLIIALYNYLRFGNPLVTGYLPQESFHTPLLTGLAGLLVSPGRGLFIYCPILLVTLPALPLFLRSHRVEGLLSLSLAIIHTLLYSKWFMWHGGFAWGPRFLVPILPFLVIPLAPLVERVGGWATAGLYLLGGVSAALQILGLSVDFSRFQILLQGELSLFAPATFFDLRYSPIWGQLFLLKPETLDFAWMKPHIDWLVLALLSSVVLISALALAYYTRAARRYAVWPLMAMTLLVVGVIGFTLARYKQDGQRDFVEMVEFIASYSQPNDAIILNSPSETLLLQNHYKGNLPVYGLFEGEPPLPPEREELLQILTTRYRRLWLIPGGVGDGLDTWLSNHGYRAFDEAFGKERLALYFFPFQTLEERPVEAIFGERIALEGFGMGGEVTPGGVFALNLRWRALAPIEEDYHIFIHLLDEEGKLWAQEDDYPAGGVRPTSGWQPGEEIEDRHALLLPLDIPRGGYKVLMGFYLLESGERLKLADREDSLFLGSVQIP